MNTQLPTTVLVVDDEIQVARLIFRYLQQIGFTGDVTSSGADALALLDTNRYDLVVTDLRMPHLHGHSLIREIFNYNPDQLVVVVTAVVESQLVYDLLSRGVQYIIPKPFSADYLTSSILGVIERSAREQSRREETLTAKKQEITLQIQSASSALNEQLANLQNHFRETIRDLEAQQADVERDYVGSVRMIAALIDHITPGGSSHVARVEEFALGIARAAGVSPRDLRDVSLAALLHDIGKFGLPENIIPLRPEAMKPDELKSYMRHPAIGSLIVSSVPGLAQVAVAIEEHHENFDGTGFPERRRGNKISLLGRILRIADHLDRLLDDKPGEAKNWETAKWHLTENSGKLYDPALVAATIMMIEGMQNEADRREVIEISPAQIKPGQQLAEDVFQLPEAADLVLLRRGVNLTETMAFRLQRELQQAATPRNIKIFKDPQ